MVHGFSYYRPHNKKQPLIMNAETEKQKAIIAQKKEILKTLKNQISWFKKTTTRPTYLVQIAQVGDSKKVLL